MGFGLKSYVIWDKNRFKAMSYGIKSYVIWDKSPSMKNRALEFGKNITVRIVTIFRKSHVDNYLKRTQNDLLFDR